MQLELLHYAVDDAGGGGCVWLEAFLQAAVEGEHLSDYDVE
jgi:hypothetical protein